MTEKTAKLLESAAKTLDLAEDVYIIPDYSGRGMYGDRTYAVVARVRITDFIAVCFAAGYDLCAIGPNDHAQIQDEVIEELGNRLRQDSLGKGYVFY